MKTKTGTFIEDDIEWNEYPPPRSLVKVMSRHWAQELLNKGILRIRHLSYFRNWENDILGDSNDGNGLFHLNGHPMSIDSAHDVYAWCASLPSISVDRINVIAEKGKYGCLLIIKNPDGLFQRVYQWFVSNMQEFWIQCGTVQYNRGDEVDKQTLNTQKFHCNIFQKSKKFAEDNEYRFSVTNLTFKKLENEYIDLEIGDCSDLMYIEELPTRGFIISNAEPQP